MTGLHKTARKAVRKALNGPTVEDTKRKRKFWNHVICLSVGVFLGATETWLHWSGVSAVVAPATPNLAMEITDLIGRL